MEKIILNVKKYLTDKGRPLELSLFKYCFEDTNLENVITALKTFQNHDGGFGHGLEPDFLTPESNPIDTWTAVNIIRTLSLEDHELIDQIIHYLIHCPYQTNELYDFVIPSNNTYPHAPWWHYHNRTENSYNPTASLIGFMYKHLKEDSPYKPMIHHRVLKAIDYFLNHDVTEMHELRCFVELYHDISDIFETSLFYKKLEQQIIKTINPNVDTWFNSYTVRPSQLILKKTTPGYNKVKDLVNLEHELLLENTNDLGVWSISWDWGTHYLEAFEISKLAWQGIIALQNLLRFKSFKFKG